MTDQSKPEVDGDETGSENTPLNDHSTHRPLPNDKEKKTSLYLALALFVVVIVGLIFGVKMAADSANTPGDPAATPAASEVAAEEGAESAPAVDNAQGLSNDAVEELAESSTDGDGLIDFIQYNPADSTYTVVVRNVSGADETYAVTVLVDGEAVGAKGVEVPASSTATVTVDVTLPRGTDEVTVRLDGETLGEGIVEVLHQN